MAIPVSKPCPRPVAAGFAVTNGYSRVVWHRPILIHWKLAGLRFVKRGMIFVPATGPAAAVNAPWLGSGAKLKDTLFSGAFRMLVICGKPYGFAVVMEPGAAE